MTLAWLLIDTLGRRKLLLWGSAALTVCFAILAITGGLSQNSYKLNISSLGPAITGTIFLFLATGAFGISWLVPPWLIPSEIYPTTARAKGTAVSVIVWGLANFTVTLLTPIMFENLDFWLFAVFAVSNGIAGVWTQVYLPESGRRSFEENQRFFKEAANAGSWKVKDVCGGEWKRMPKSTEEGAEGSSESTPLLSR